MPSNSLARRERQVSGGHRGVAGGARQRVHLDKRLQEGRRRAFVLVGPIGHRLRGAVVRQALQRDGIPRAVLGEASGKRAIVLRHPDGRMDMEPRVRLGQHTASTSQGTSCGTDTGAAAAVLADAHRIGRAFVTLLNQRRYREVEQIPAIGGDAASRAEFIRLTESAAEFGAGFERVCSAPDPWSGALRPNAFST